MSRSFALILLLACPPLLAQEPPAPPRPLTQEQQDKLREAAQLNDQAVELYQKGKIREGIARAQKVLEITKQVLGERHPSYATGLNNLARLYASEGEYAKAEPLFQKALDLRKQVLGERHPDYANSLNNLAALYASQGEYAKAEPLLQKALDIRKQVLGERHPAYAVSLNNLAFLYASQREYAKAEPLLRQGLEIFKRVLGEHHPDYASSLHNLATLYDSQGEYAKAQPLYQQALDIRKQVLGERHPDYADSLRNLASLYCSQREYAKAVPLAQKALEITKQVLGEHHPDYADSLHNLAFLYASQGEYVTAEPLYQKALDIRKQALGERHPHYASSLNNLAALYQSQGEYAKAEPLFQKALDINKQVLGERHPDYARSLSNLAMLYQSRGEYAKAEPLHQKALDIYKQVLGERHPDYATSLNNLALLYYSQGEYAKAEPLFQKALDIRKQVLGERHPHYASSLNNLAGLYKEQGEYAKAEPLLQKALDIYKQVLGERHPDYALSLNNLADLYQSQGEYAKAEPLCHKALDIRKRVQGERHPDYALSLNNLAVLYYSQGEYAKAEALYQKAIAVLRQRTDDQPIEFEQLTAPDLRPLPGTVRLLAHYCLLLEQRLGSHPTALQLRSADHAFALALGVRDRLRQEVLETDASKLQQGAKESDLIPGRIGLCQRLFEREGKAADLETAFFVAEQGTARVFLEQLGKAQALTVGRVSPELRQQEAAFRQQQRGLDARISKEQAKTSDKRDPEKVGKLLDEQKQVEARLSELIRRMEREYPQYAALKYPRPCSLAEARACLTDNEVALLFVLGSEQSYVVLVEAWPARGDKANGLAIYPLPRSEEIADAVAALTDSETIALPVKARSLAEQAYGLLLAPLKDRIKGKDLVIVPSGPLCYLPFELLVEDGRYLIEKHRIRYAPSLTALHMVRQWEQTRARPQQAFFALGDPVYDARDGRLERGTAVVMASQAGRQEVQTREGRQGEAFNRLAFSGREVEAIAQLLHAPSGNILTGPQALEAKVKEASASGVLAKARFLHFATHGILGLDLGQQPALVLSLVGNDGQRDEDGGVNDGFLRLDEVTRLQLNADLVVLSACRTGQGRLYNGEGVTSLARAFLYAGSRGVVSSLWSVDDRETANLMTALYGQLQQGRASVDALRFAKLGMIRQGKPPVYWAPFILSGE